MHILIAGSSGLIGSALVRQLRAAGRNEGTATGRGGVTGSKMDGSTAHTVQRLVRRPPRHRGELQWDPATGRLEPHLLDGVDAVVNLSGAGIGDRPWSRSRVELLYSSRLNATNTLVRAMHQCAVPPKIFLSQSAAGYYGERGGELLPESAGPGSNILADLCTKWERAALAAPDTTRVTTTRSAVVFSRTGGVLPLMLLPLRAGLGGPLGDGRHWMPWISLADKVRALEFLLHQEIAGPVNLAAPGAAPFRTMMQVFGGALHRPARLAVPAALLRAGLGEMALELLLASARMTPDRFTAAGFRFTHPDLASFAATLTAASPNRTGPGR